MARILTFPGGRFAPVLPGCLEILQAEFLARLTARGAAANTLAAYRVDLLDLRAFLVPHDVRLVQLLSERLLNAWLDHMLLHRGVKRRTAARKLATVRAFVRFCQAERMLDHDPTEHVRIKFRPVRQVAPEMDRLLAMIRAIGQTKPVDLRDRAMLLLTLDGGLRAQDVVALDVPNSQRAPTWTVNLAGLRVYVPHKGGETGEADVVAIEPQTVRALQRWLKVRDQLARPDEAALFVGVRGERLSRQLLHRTIARRGQAAGIRGLHPHLLRHRRIGDITERCGLDAARAHARHASKATTAAIYGEHEAEVSRATIRARAPLGEVA